MSPYNRFEYIVFRKMYPCNAPMALVFRRTLTKFSYYYSKALYDTALPSATFCYRWSHCFVRSDSDHREFQSTQYHMVAILKACEERGGAKSSARKPLFLYISLHTPSPVQSFWYFTVWWTLKNQQRPTATNCILTHRHRNGRVGGRGGGGDSQAWSKPVDEVQLGID